MVSREMIEIILRAEDQASQVFKENEKNMKRFGDAAKQANDKAARASQQLQQKTGLTGKEVNHLSVKLRQVGENGRASFDKLSKSEQDALIKFNMLDKGSQNLLQHINKVGNANMSGLQGAISDAKSKFQALDGVTKTWSGSMDYSRSKLQLLGTDTDSLRGKIQVVGSAIPTYLGTKWDGIKSKVTSLGDHIKTKLTSALSSVRSGLDSLGNAFSGLGGIITSAIGMLGMSSITDLTVGLSMGRERMTALTQATTGSAQAADNLINGYKNLNYEFKDLNGNSTHTFMGLDEMTNHSLVGLDSLGQAMSNFKMATGATNDQLAYVAPVINDIGQRAILMGKSSDEALSLMQGAAQGLNGNFMSLKRTFGVTKDKLMEMGWSGAADDVEGYTDALQKYLEKGGKMDEMMDTSVGHLETLKKNFRIAGRHVGDKFTPYIDQAVVKLNDLNDSCPGLFEGLVEIAGGVSMFATLAPTLSPMLLAYDNLKGKVKSLLVFTGLLKGEEDALTISTLSNTIAEKANAIAKAAGGTAALTATGANAGLTASLWAMTTALLANPITWVVVALIALAVAAYEVGKSFGWWKDVGTMIDAIRAGLGRLWAAFVNNPNVQGFIQDLTNLWNGLCDALHPVIDWAKKVWVELFPSNTNFDIVRVIIDIFGQIGRICGDVVNGIKIMYAKFGLFGVLVGLVSTPVQAIVGVLRTIICALLGCSPGIVPALEKVQEVFGSVWNAIAGFIGGVITNIVSAIQPIIDILSQIASFYLATFIYAWQTVIMVFNIVRTSVNLLINIFSLFLSGQINLQTMLNMVWTTLSQMFALVLTTIILRVRSWASNLLSKAISAGRGFVSGVIRFVSSLPGRFAGYLASVLTHIVSSGSQWVSTGISKASSLVSGVITNVSQLPGKVYNEFAKIPGKIQQAAIQAATSAGEFGQKILNAVLNSLGIHSPGLVQNKIAAEFTNTVRQIANKIKGAYDTAKSFGNAIVEGFGNPTLETNTENILPNEDALKTSIGVNAQLSTPIESATTTMDTSAVANGNTEVIGSYDNLAAMTGSALQNMVDRDKLAYETIRTNDANTLTQMSTNLAQKMGAMTNNVSSNMNSIVSKNKSGMNTVNNTTKSHLNSIVSKTKSANTQMIKAWGTMKDGIISAADKIKSESTTHFNKLSETIGSFYGKLKNPSRWGAGSPITRSRGSSSRGLGKLTSALRNANISPYMTSGQIKANPSIVHGDFGDYITKNNLTGKYNMMDLLRYGAIKVLGKGAGSYADSISPNVKLIKDTSKEWDMKGPLVGKFQTNTGFKVKEFLTGVPKITFDVFRGIAEDVFGQTKYEFYYDNDHHGNWVNAFNAGSMNCLHGAEALIALAQTMGLSGSLQHGHWTDSSGTYGHYFANIAGHKMDVTGWQQRRTWTPSASAGPAPKSIGFKDVIEQLIDIFKDDPDKPTSNGGLQTDGETVTGEFTIIHDFKNLPDGITAEEVAALIEESTTNDNFIKKLAQNPVFQKWDLKTKTVLENKNNRARGV